MRAVLLCLISISVGAVSVVCMLRGLQVWASGMNIGGMKSPQPLPVGPGKAVLVVIWCSCLSELVWQIVTMVACCGRSGERLVLPETWWVCPAIACVPCYCARCGDFALDNTAGMAACEPMHA